jgi:hypothetical protein
MKHHTHSKEDRLNEMTKWRENEKKIKARLEYLRGEIDAERISYGEIAELQGLAKYIEKDDVKLLEWAGITYNGEIKDGDNS